MGEKGLGERYSILLTYIPSLEISGQYSAGVDLVGSKLYDLLTLPLQTRVDAMIKVVKNWHLSENKMWTGEGDNEPA